MKQLKDQQTRYAPRDRRLEQIDRAEQLLTEIDAGKRYPYEYVCYRITGYRPEGWPALVLDGGDVQHDLRLFQAGLLDAPKHHQHDRQLTQHLGMPAAKAVRSNRTNCK